MPVSTTDAERLFYLQSLGVSLNSTLSLADLQSLYFAGGGVQSDKTVPTGVKRHNYPRIFTASVTLGTLVSGRLALTAIDLRAGDVINSITFSSGSTAMVTPTNQWFGLYDKNRNLLAVTADDGATAWAVNSDKTLALTAPYTVLSSDLYYVGIVVVAVTVPTLVGINANSTVLSVLPKISFASTTALTNPASAPASALDGAAFGSSPYIRVQ